MSHWNTLPVRASMLGLAIFASANLHASPPERWDGVIDFGSLEVPFTMQMEFSETSVAAVFSAKGEQVASTAGTLTGDAVMIRFDSLGTTLTGDRSGGSIKATYGKASDPPAKRQRVELNKFCTCGFVGEAGPDISGTWSIDGGGALVVQREGEDTFVQMQLTANDGPSGTLAGRFDGVSFTLSRFTGTTGAVLEAEPRKDGKLDLNLQLSGKPAKKLVASKSSSK
jgi:hypothetical protein